MKKKALLSSILTIVLCISLIAGSTFALFTSESQVNIAVTSGKVKLTATIGELELYTPTEITGNGVITDAENKAEGNQFGEGGYAELVGNKLKLVNMIPGDKATAVITLDNESNVNIQYRVIVKSVGEDDALLEALKITIGEGESAVSFTGDTVKFAWMPLAIGNNESLKVTVELPGDTGNGYQEKECELAFTVEAVQGNADMPDEWDGTTVTTLTADEDGVYHISTAAEFVEYMNSINKNDGKHYYKVVLDRDIDLGGYTYEVSGVAAAFSGSFDGQNHTVSNYVIKRADNDECHYTGLFSIQSYAQDGRTTTIENLTVKNGTVIAKSSNQVSAIAPNMEANGSIMKNCHAIDCTVIGHKKVGAITGYVVTGSTIENCSATNCNVIATAASKHTEADKQNATIYGYNNGGTFTNNAEPIDCVAVSGVDYVLTNAAEFKAYITELNNDPLYGAHRYDKQKVVLTNDIDLGGAVITASGEGYMFSGSFDGLGHTVSNYTIKRTDDKYYTGLFSVYMNGASIKNLTVKNGTVISNGGQVGAVVASVNEGATVENCKAYNCIVSGKDQVGSVVGYACDGIVKDCYAEDCTVLYSKGKHQTNQEYLNGNGNGNNRGEVVGFINTIGDKVDNTSNNTYNNVTVGQGTYVANGVVLRNGAYEISNAQGLVYCATTFNRADNTINKVFKLTADIDMTGIEWTPWCNEAQYFNGLFDGQNHTISNLTIADNDTAENGHGVGFIGRLGANANGEKILQNVTFDKANVSGHHWVGVAVGYNEFGKVDNVKVTNSKVTATCATDDSNASPCGDKAGALIGICGPNTGYVSVTNCSATNCEVKAARDAAQLIGLGYANTTYSNLSATNVTVTANAGSCTHSRAGVVSANALVGNGTAAGLSLN